jgi:hypothetical protein
MSLLSDNDYFGITSQARTRILEGRLINGTGDLFL